MAPNDSRLDLANTAYLRMLTIRNSKSVPYERGVLASFRFLIAGEPINKSCSYSVGTAEFDDFLAGVAEGDRLWSLRDKEQ